MEVSRIKAATGLDVEGYSHAVAPGDLRHIINEHGSVGTEAPRGLLPVKKQDVESLHRLLPRAIKIERGDTRFGVDSIRYTIPSGDSNIVVVELVRMGKRRLLTLKTMVKMKNRAVSNAAFVAPSVTSQTFRADSNKIAFHRGHIKSLLGQLKEDEAQ